MTERDRYICGSSTQNKKKGRSRIAEPARDDIIHHGFFLRIFTLVSIPGEICCSASKPSLACAP